jgi:zinc protease
VSFADLSLILQCFIKEHVPMRRLFLPALFALIVPLGPPAARGQSKPDLPTAETVLNQYIEATGGKDAYKKITSRVLTGTVELTGANIMGPIKLTQAVPNKLLLVMTLGPIGETKQGTDGKDAWEVSAVTGERDMSGEEKEAFIRDASFYKELDWKELYAKVECVGTEDVEGKPAYKVVLSPKSGKPTTQYYDKTNHLVVKQTSTTNSPMGEISVDVYPSDYRSVDGILIPFTVTQKVLTQQIVMKMKEIKQNVEAPADLGRRPAPADAPVKKKAD